MSVHCSSGFVHATRLRTEAALRIGKIAGIAVGNCRAVQARRRYEAQWVVEAAGIEPAFGLLQQLSGCSVAQWTPVFQWDPDDARIDGHAPASHSKIG